MYCDCKTKHPLVNDANKQVFTVCAKSKGGCGREIRADGFVEAKPSTTQCDFADCKCPAEKRRQKTQYIDEDSNFSTLCKDHQKEVDEYWDDMWSGYYSSIY